MSSTPDEFRAKTRKTVTLPSGLIVEIRKVRARDFINIGDIPIAMSAPDSQDGEIKLEKAETFEAKLAARDRADRLGRIAVVNGVISPPMSDRDTDKNNPAVVHVGDLDQTDFYVLVAEILDWSGLSKEAGQAAESFRADAKQGSRGSPGTTIQ